MKKICLQLVLTAITLSLISSCQKSIHNSPAFAQPASAELFSSQVRERPFKGRIVGSFINTPTSNPAIYQGIANASGNVTHLGVFNKVTRDVINIVSSTVDGTFIMTNPAGEQITGKYSGTFSFGSTPGTFSWILNALITGGTGRFFQATGEFVFLANGNYSITDGVSNGNYTETFEGTIVY